MSAEIAELNKDLQGDSSFIDIKIPEQLASFSSGALRDHLAHRGLFIGFHQIKEMLNIAKCQGVAENPYWNRSMGVTIVRDKIRIALVSRPLQYRGQTA